MSSRRRARLDPVRNNADDSSMDTAVNVVASDIRLGSPVSSSVIAWRCASAVALTSRKVTANRQATAIRVSAASATATRVWLASTATASAIPAQTTAGIYAARPGFGRGLTPDVGSHPATAIRSEAAGQQASIQVPSRYVPADVWNK